jgi:hypothetical protein
MTSSEFSMPPFDLELPGSFNHLNTNLFYAICRRVLFSDVYLYFSIGVLSSVLFYRPFMSLSKIVKCARILIPIKYNEIDWQCCKWDCWSELINAGAVYYFVPNSTEVFGEIFEEKLVYVLKK